ncbi:BTB/POZ domain-containing protein 6-like isoform X3 [Haliotis rufescens]|uniref:BTB/POZ domain-containing protein 6-like isoform X3 n=1 Tax=Haliotis rufescens TaxID=6454 RepID=UPI00201EB3B9|nr:BTB/POZ domain-containing protein 6-like isoform X3 [Haliotis rufescens]
MASVEVREDNSGFVDNWQSGKSLAECNLHMLSSEDSCDVSFRVGKEEKLVRAHRYVLMSRSSVFHAMLCGPLAEKEEIKIPDVEEETFSEMLRYLYTDTSSMTAENVTGVLYLAKKYAVGSLERLCLTYLESSLTAENACAILEQAHVFDEAELFDRALEVIVQNGDIAFESHGFKDLCHTCFHKIVSAEDFVIKPEIVFTAAILWAEEEVKRREWESTPENKRLVLGESVYELGFTAMGIQEFAKTVVPSGILSGDECTKLFCFLSISETDASPFKVRPAPAIALYANTISTDLSELESYITISCSHNMRLIGLWAFGTETSRYNIVIDRKLGKPKRWIEQMRISAKPSRRAGKEVKLELSEQTTLEANVYYRFRTHISTGTGGWLGTQIRKSITVGKCQIAVSQMYEDGVISRLMLRICELS